MLLSTWTRGHAVAMLLAGSASWLWAQPWPALAAAFTSIGVLTASFRGRWTPSGALGPANVVTLGRLALLLLATGAAGWTSASWLFEVVWVLVLILDGVDGAIARRHGLDSDYGAALDVETDALLIALMGLSLYLHGLLGAWVLLLGALRYVYVLSEAMAPIRPTGHRTRWARHLFVWSAITLSTPYLLPPPLAQPLAAAGGLLLSASFARSFFWLATGR